jgi:signal transduction histidine kinase/PAS domain-containing protein
MGLLNTPSSLVTAKRQYSPLRILCFLVLLIYLAETVTMVILYILDLPGFVAASLLDGAIMLVLIFPALYLLQLKPLLNQMEERAQVEQALRTSETHLKRVMEALPVGVLIIDKDGYVIHGNSASKGIWAGVRYGSISEYVEYKGWWAETGKRIEPEEWAAVRAITLGETSLNEEIKIQAFDGAQKTILNSAIPILDKNNLLQGAVIVNQDITERKQAEIHLESQNQKLLALSNAEQKQRQLAESLVQATIALNSSLKLEEVLDSILEQIDRAIPFQMADIALVENRILRVVGYRAAEGYPQAIGAISNSYPLNNFPLLSTASSKRQSIFITDTRDSPAWQPAPGLEWVLSFAAAPLIIDDQVIGFINLNSDRPGYFDEEKANRLTAFAVPAALAIQNARLYMKESHARQVAETLGIATQALTQTLDLEKVIDTLLENIDAILNADIAGIALLEGETRLTARRVIGSESSVDTDQILSIVLDSKSSPIVQRLLSSHKSVQVPDTSTYPDWNQLPGLEQVRSWLLVPLIAGKKVIGVVGLGNIEAGNFTHEQIQWAELLSGQAAMAVQNAWLFGQVRSSSERLQSLARKLVELQESERAHIARELHDEAGQALSSLKLSLGRLEQDPDCPQHIRLRLLNLNSVADVVLDDLHRLAMDLRPVALDHLGLVAALEQFANHLNSERLSVQFKAVGFDSERLPKDVETSLYRIVQEALTNVLRHAHASNVGILVERNGGRVKLFVEDNGIGFSPNEVEKGERLGLVGMRERAEMFDGSLSIESSLESGTSIIVEVPDAYSYAGRR